MLNTLFLGKVCGATIINPFKMLLGERDFLGPFQLVLFWHFSHVDCLAGCLFPGEKLFGKVMSLLLLGLSAISILLLRLAKVVFLSIPMVVMLWAPAGFCLNLMPFSIYMKL